jgi:hypothetical protein
MLVDPCQTDVAMKSQILMMYIFKIEVGQFISEMAALVVFMSLIPWLKGRHLDHKVIFHLNAYKVSSLKNKTTTTNN